MKAVDLFAGLGGYTEGAQMAGVSVVWAANHWRLAVDAHARNRIRRAQSISGRRCLVQHVTGHPGVPLHEAIRTITTKDQWVLVDGEQYRPLTVREYARGMGFRDSYELPTGTRADVVKAIGNAVCPPKARDVVSALAEAA
jgi:site-specific DNA-cytosine methylase